jgi:hypothetical protein
VDGGGLASANGGMGSSLSLPRFDRLSGPGWLAVGFLYWLALVCALEPGNLAAASVPPPWLREVRQELAANFVLLVFGLSVFLGFVLLVRRGQAQPEGLVFSERGRALVIHPRDIEWIESQGNYQAIRAGGVTHLVRRTLDDLEGRLDPDRFVRIHRRTIVAVAGVRTLAALSNGDAEVAMTDGTTLRVTRGRRARLSQALAKLA